MIVLITGASSGLGQALTQAYLDRGDTVVAVARRTGGRLGIAIDRPNLIVRQADVTDRDAIAAVIADIQQTIGPVAVGIASAGVAMEQTGPDLDLDAFDVMIRTNTVGGLNTLVPLARRMRERGFGQIVAISSLAAVHGLPWLAGYAASKAALDRAVQAMRLLLHGSCVLVTLVSPGFIATPMTDARVHPRWCVPLDKAVSRILAGIDSGRATVRFPLWQHIGLGMVGWLPYRMQSALLSRAGRWIRPKADHPPCSDPSIGKVC